MSSLLMAAIAPADRGRQESGHIDQDNARQNSNSVVLGADQRGRRFSILRRPRLFGITLRTIASRERVRAASPRNGGDASGHGATGRAHPSARRDGGEA